MEVSRLKKVKKYTRKQGQGERDYIIVYDNGTIKKTLWKWRYTQRQKCHIK